MTTLAARAMILSTVAVIVLAMGAATSQAAGRITGGTKVDRTEYDARWQSIVSLREAIEGEAVLGDERSGWREGHQCGGVLVRPDIVVTAAHCVDGGTWRHLVQGRLRILAGSRRLGDDVARQPGQQVDVADLRIHPSWEGGGDMYEDAAPQGFDLAVLRLETPITTVQPMRIVGADDATLWGNGAGLPSGAFVAGWGVTNALYDRVDIDEADNVQVELRETALPLLSDSTCERTDLAMGVDAEDFDRATMLCGYARDTDARVQRSNRRGPCYGDSGGPLAVIGADGAPRLAGIVSWGPSREGGCQLPSVFTRIATAGPWIEAAIADLAGPSPLVAAAPTSGTVVGASSVRLRWPAASGAPERYSILREVPLRRASELDDEDEDLMPAVRRWLLAQRYLVPMGSTGRESREMVVADVPPGRRGQRLVHRFRIQVRDDAGRVSRSEPLAVQAPIDARRPSRPAARGTNATAFERDRGFHSTMPPPSISWRAVRDNDCVERYVVQVAEIGTRRWRKVLEEGAGDCPDDSPYAELYGDGDEEGIPPGTRFVAAIPGVDRGPHLVRIAAVDRAGNVAWSAPSRVLIRPTSGQALCRYDGDGSSSCSWSSGSSGGIGSFG